MCTTIDKLTNVGLRYGLLVSVILENDQSVLEDESLVCENHSVALTGDYCFIRV